MTTGRYAAAIDVTPARSLSQGRSRFNVLLVLACFSLGCPLTALGQASPGYVLLSEAGLDVKLLNDVKNGSVQAFVEEENELFAQLAEAMLHLEANPPSESAAPFDLMAALQKPEDYKGNFVQLQGTVRRITPIQVTSPRLQGIIGQQGYYQVDLFVSTNKTRFQLKDTQGQVTIASRYGITLILFELPEIFLQTKQVTVSVPGIFLKNWSHKTVETREVSDELRRPNPIVFGIGSLARKVDLTAGQGTIDSIIGWFWGGLIVLLGALGFWQWWGNRKRKLRLAEKADSVDLSGLE